MPVAVDQPASTNWADDDGVEERVALPAPSEVSNPDGTITTTEWRYNEDGKKVKITRKIKRSTQVREVSHAVAERKHWAKFGAEKGKPAGPDRATTTVAEDMQFKVSAGGQKAEPEQDESAKLKAQLGSKKIACRICKGDHFTSKCPIKDTLEGAGMGDLLAGGEPPLDDAPTPAEAMASAAGGSKYVPPSMRAGSSRPAGESMFNRNRDDLPTLRITSLSTDADEDDLRDMFGRYGRIARANVVRDRETGESKGFAFVSFESRADGEKAMKALDGRGYDNLILSVSWSLPREPRQQ